jgi:hypothetical protein
LADIPTEGYSLPLDGEATVEGVGPLVDHESRRFRSEGIARATQ